MKKLDLYILKKYFTTFFFSIFLFTVIAVVVDVSEKTDDFVKSGFGFWGIVMNYYIGFVPYIIALLFPLFVFISVIFFTSKMANKSEFVAMLASGTSFQRMLMPYWLGGISLSLLLLFAANFVIPKANEIRTNFEAKYVDKLSSYKPLTGDPNKHDLYFRIDSFTYAGIKGYDTALKSGGPFFMQRLKNDTLVYNLRAEYIRWDTTKGLNKWVLDRAFERHINGLKENVVATQKKQMNFNFKPFDLSHDEYAKDKLTTPQLMQFIQLEQLRGSENVNELEVEKWRRYATPFAVIILTLIGAIVATKKVRGGSGMHIAMGLILALAFILMDRFSTVFSAKGSLPPVVAAWLPDFVFSWVAFYLFKKAPK